MTLLEELYFWLSNIDARIWQAVIGGGVVAFGWLINGKRNRRAEARLRAEQVRDLHKAIFAEIKPYILALKRDRLQDYEADMVARMRTKDPETGEPFIPLIPRESNDAVFMAAIEHIHILPRQTIDPIVAYYSQLKAISTLIDDMRGEDFRRISTERRINVYQDYIRMKLYARDVGEYAQRVIAAYASGGKSEAEALLAKEWVARHSGGAAREWLERNQVNTEEISTRDEASSDS